MALLTPRTLPDIQRALIDADLDGWLLYEFRGVNPIASSMVGLESILSRRIFAWVPREGVPVAITHNIEQGAWRHWPSAWRRERYSAWRTLEALLRTLVGGRRIAMEYSAGDAVPYLDRVPAGVLEMVRAAGATVVTSGELVSRFYATWTADDLAAHRRAAEHVAAIGREALAYAGSRARSADPTTEHEVQGRIMQAFERAGLVTYSPPNVSVGPNAADPHYEPSADHPQLITLGNVLLIDLWAREAGHPYADQTWMAAVGATSERVDTIWRAIRDARDAAIASLRTLIGEGKPVRGKDVDDVTRAVVSERGFADHFTHRTGHSLDARDIHGSGPNLDNLETRDERLLIPGVGFSIEPGIYLPGDLGMRTEVNAYVGVGELVVTPVEYQHDLIVV
jgi:Xaa-Pro aminopeptidase